MKLFKFRPARLRVDLANGYLLAEVLSKFFPAQISSHSYDRGVSAAAKSNNWTQLVKFFAKNSPPAAPSPVLKPADVALLTDPSAGSRADDAGIHVLLDVYRFLFRAKLVPKLSAWMGEEQRKGAVKMMQVRDWKHTFFKSAFTPPHTHTLWLSLLLTHTCGFPRRAPRRRS